MAYTLQSQNHADGRGPSLSLNEAAKDLLTATRTSILAILRALYNAEKRQELLLIEAFHPFAFFSADPPSCGFSSINRPRFRTCVAHLPLFEKRRSTYHSLAEPKKDFRTRPCSFTEFTRSGCFPAWFFLAVMKRHFGRQESIHCTRRREFQGPKGRYQLHYSIIGYSMATRSENQSQLFSP